MHRRLYLTLRVVIGLVWFVNGLACKVLMLVPRHGQIVDEILGSEYSLLLTRLIGLGEIALAIWIWSGFRPRWNALLQIGLVATMNVMEFLMAPDLLLWGKFNALFATMFFVLVGWHEFWLRPRSTENAIAK